MGAILKKIARAMYKKKPEKLENVPDSFFQLSGVTLDGRRLDFQSFKGKKKAFLIVNVASACQLTNQNYKQMNSLYESYRPMGLEILCFPCNQFYNTEPRCDKDLEQYLREHFQPEFPVFQKVACNGEEAHAVFKYLRKNTPEFKERLSLTKSSSISNEEGLYKPIPLTFAKFLLDGEGRVMRYYEPVIYPNSIIPDIEYLLKINP